MAKKQVKSSGGSCPKVRAKFNKLVNMSPSSIRAWSKNPNAKLASEAATRKRLPALANLKGKASGSWTAKDCKFANRVISFNSRMSGAARRDKCTVKEDVSLRNWGRKDPACRGRGLALKKGSR